MLDIETLKKKQAAIKEDFDTVQKEIQQITERERGLADRKAQLNVELFRLQGENRVVEDLMKTLEPATEEEIISEEKTV